MSNWGMLQFWTLNKNLAYGCSSGRNEGFVFEFCIRASTCRLAHSRLTECANMLMQTEQRRGEARRQGCLHRAFSDSGINRGHAVVRSPVTGGAAQLHAAAASHHDSSDDLPARPLRATIAAARCATPPSPLPRPFEVPRLCRRLSHHGGCDRWRAQSKTNEKCVFSGLSDPGNYFKKEIISLIYINVLTQCLLVIF